MTARRAAILGFAGAAVLLSAADTYVVVLALPAMIGDIGIGIDQLQKATPIISGFLLGYVAVMPLIGRLSDVYGRAPVFVACLGVFAAGSLITASAHDLATIVTGRALQGLGGGGLVPVTLALVADMWSAERRGFPLGVVGALQELGSVVGPLYGAAILTVSTWRTIFWINLPISALLGIGLFCSRPRLGRPATQVAGHGRFDWPGVTLAVLALASAALLVAAPGPLVDSDTLGTLYAPIGDYGWLTPLTLAALLAAGAFVGWEVSAPPGVRALMRPAAVISLARRADWLGSGLLALALAGVVVAFAGADPSREPISSSAVWLLPLAAVAAGAFALRERAARSPLVDLHALSSRQAVGALITNLATGAALLTVLVNVPILARVTVSPDSQLGAAAVLLRLLAAVPVGALLGGWSSQRFGNRTVAVVGLASVTAMLSLMAHWSAGTLSDPFGPAWLHPSDPALVVAGLGFGLVIAPVNAAMLSAVRASLHGLAAALVVVARMVGMLVGISILTAVGLQAFFNAERKLPSALALCPNTPLSCAAYNNLVTGAVITELRAVFLGAAACAAIATAVAALTLRSRQPRGALLVS